MEKVITISGKEIEGKINLEYQEGFINAKLFLHRAPNNIVFRCYLQNDNSDNIYLGICEPIDGGLGLSVNVRGNEEYYKCLITIGRMDEAYQISAVGEVAENIAEVSEVENIDLEKSDEQEYQKNEFEEMATDSEADQEIEGNLDKEIAVVMEDNLGEDIEETVNFEDFDESQDGENLNNMIERNNSFNFRGDSKCAMVADLAVDEVIDSVGSIEEAKLQTAGTRKSSKHSFVYIGLSFVKCTNIMNEQLTDLEKEIFMYDGINYAFKKYGYVLRAYEENAVIYAIPSNIYKDPHPILHLALYTSYHNIKAFDCDGYFIIGVDKQKKCYFTVIDE